MVQTLWVHRVVHVSQELFVQSGGLKVPAEHTSAVVVDAPPVEKHAQGSASDPECGGTQRKILGAERERVRAAHVDVLPWS